MNKILIIKTKLYLKYFLISGLISCIIFPVINYLFGDITSITALIFETIVFSAFMSWLLTVLHLNTLKSNGIIDLDGKCLKLKQVEVIQKTCSIAQLSKLLKQDKKTRKWKQFVSGSKIRLKTGISSQSWGEIILISILENRIKIESKPVFLTTIIDSGKNRSNIKTIKDIIEKSNI